MDADLRPPFYRVKPETTTETKPYFTTKPTTYRPSKEETEGVGSTYSSSPSNRSCLTTTDVQIQGELQQISRITSLWNTQNEDDCSSYHGSAKHSNGSPTRTGTRPRNIERLLWKQLNEIGVSESTQGIAFQNLFCFVWVKCYSYLHEAEIELYHLPQTAHLLKICIVSEIYISMWFAYKY
jgi:hypothetical protein